MVLQFPRIFFLPDQISSEELASLKEVVGTCTDNIEDATVVVGRLNRRERALFELRRRRLLFSTDVPNYHPQTASEVPNAGSPSTERQHDVHRRSSPTFGTLSVVNIDWIVQSLNQKQVLALKPYLICEVWKKSTGTQPSKKSVPNASSLAASESDGNASLSESNLTEIPPIVHITTQGYSCQRATPKASVNTAFVTHLKEIRELRKVKGDNVGTRAYSTAIAAIAAQPLPLRTRTGKCFISVFERSGTAVLTHIRINRCGSYTRLRPENW